MGMFGPKVERIGGILTEAGATELFVVGGSVRDRLLCLKNPSHVKIDSKDIDLEVYGISYEKIESALKPHFPVNRVGKSFGALKIGTDIDVVLPRTESKIGSGHKGFDAVSDPELPPKVAFARRDFTLNAMGMRLDGTLVDFYGGQNDLERKILRAVSPAFKEDPLRVLRGMQFAARFGMTMEPGTATYCRELLPEFGTLSEERIYEEWHKWGAKGKYPSMGLDVLEQTGWIGAFPELSPLVGCRQNPSWHPEGDVWTHTKLVTNTMRAILDGPESVDLFSEEDQTAMMFAALAHDFGKPAATTIDSDGTIRSHGHAEIGAELAATFLTRMRAPFRIVETVRPLVAEHMAITKTDKIGEPSPRTLRRLACRLTPASIRQWTILCQSDALGCFPPATIKRQVRFNGQRWLEQAEAVRVTDARPKPLVLGRDLILRGISPGPKLGEILAEAFEAQLDGEFDTPDAGLAWLAASGRLP